MSIFAVALLCIQACLIENIYSQCLGKAGLASAITPIGIAGSVAAPYASYGYSAGCGAGYGGSGVSNIRVAGELPVTGTAVVSGYVPIIGAVEFSGPAAAAGAVCIAGACGCGCGCGGTYM